MPVTKKSKKSVKVDEADEVVKIIDSSSQVDQGSNEVGSNEVGSNEVGSNEVGSNEVGSNEVGSNEVGSNEVGSNGVESSGINSDVESSEVLLTEQEESLTEVLFNKLVNQFQDVQLLMKTLHTNLKVLQKEVLKERKELKKKEQKHKKKSSKKKTPSGFAKPSLISNELSSFLNLPDDSQLARTDVTSKVIAYIKEKDLQNPENKKQILLDEPLNKLLQPSEGDIITFFNLQTHLKKHFLPPVVTVVSEGTSVLETSV